MNTYLEQNYKTCILIAVLIAIVIFTSSSLQSLALASKVSFLSTLYHFSIFFFLAFFLSSGLNGKIKTKTIILLAVLIAILYGITDEIHQLFVPGRFCSLEDILVDSIGILTANVFYLIIKRFDNKK